MRSLRTTYFIVANTALLFLLVQFTTHIGILALESVLQRPRATAVSEAVRRNYAHMSPADVDALLRASERLRFRYQRVVGYMNAALSSPFVNVDEHGIRANRLPARGIEALDNAIWFFGGSTAFGDGVADHESIPAQLESLLGRPVINLGVRNYGSPEENLLLNHYLRIGYHPSLALFFDGINEMCVEPYSDEMRILFDHAQGGYQWDLAGPVAYASARVAHKLRKMTGRAVDEFSESLTCVNNGTTHALKTLHARRLTEREALCRLYRIDCRTLVQPFAGLHGRHDELDRDFRRGEGQYLRDLFAHLEPNWRSAGAVFVTDALDRIDHHAFVDEIHYSAEGNRAIAETIAARVDFTPGTRE